MSWLGRLKFWGRVTTSVDPRIGGYGLPLQSFVPADLSLSRHEMLTLSTVFACVRLIAESVAQCLWTTSTRTPAGQRLVAFDDPVAWLLNTRPNPDLPAQSFWEAMATAMLTSGNAYAEISFDGAGRVNALWPLTAGDAFGNIVRLERNPKGELIYVVTQTQGGEVRLEAWRVLHLRGLCLDGLFGHSILSLAGRAVAGAVAAEKYGAAYFSNSATPSGVLLSKVALTPESFRRLNEQWKARGKPGRQHGVAILDGDLTYQALQNNAEESQVVETRQLDVETVARYFGVPLVLLSVAASSQGYGTNIAQLYRSFTRSTLNPYLARLQQECTYKLYPQRAPWRELVLSSDPLTRAEPAEIASTNEALIRSGQRTINEVRSDSNFSPIKGGDDLLVSGSLKPLAQVLEPPKALPASAPLTLPAGSHAAPEVSNA